MFFEKFNPFRVVDSSGCVFCMEIRPLQGHFLINVNRFYNVFRVLFLLLTFQPFRFSGTNH
jgi:hypothetical protein